MFELETTIPNVLSIDNNKCCGQLYRWYYRQNRERIHIFILGLINDIELEILIFNMYDRKMSKYKLHNINIQSNETCFIIFNKLVILIEKGLILRHNIRFYIGYSGWSEGQLLGELKTGSWIVSEWHTNYTFKTPSKKLWSEALNHKGDRYGVIGQIPQYEITN